MKRARLLGALLAGLLLGGCHPPGGPEAGKVVTIAILPAYSLDVMAKRYLPLMEYLSRETGYRMEYVSSLSYTHYLGVVEHSRVDFGIQNPLLFQILKKTRGAYAVAQMVGPGGSPVERGVIVVRADSGIQEIGQLKGKRAMAISKSALVGYLAQAQRLVEAGIQPEEKVRIIRGGKQDQLLVRVLLEGRVDAVFVREDALKAVEGSGALARLRVIGTTDFFPTWCLAAFPETDPEVVSRVREALLKLTAENPEQAPLLAAMGVTRFALPDSGGYQKVLDLVAALGVPL